MARKVQIASIDGLPELLKTLKALEHNATAKLSLALQEEANVAFAESQILTPIDTGALRGSGVVRSPIISRTGVSVSIDYGGTAGGILGYALYVHEITRYRHAPPTQAKFLETPVANRKNDLIKNLTIRIKQMMTEGLKTR